MFLKLSVKDARGNARGSVRMKLDFEEKQWSVEENKLLPWQHVGFSPVGSFEPKDWGVSWVWDRDVGGRKHNTIIFYDPPRGELDFRRHCGQARLYDPRESAFKDSIIHWNVDRTPAPLSAVRTKMLQLLDAVPRAGLSSDDPVFKDYTGFDTASLKSQFWDKPTVPDPKDPTKTIANPSLDFTTCNAFLGVMARKLGRVAGVEVGYWLGAGVLQLDLVDKDVKGSWIPKDPLGRRRPKPGDIYSRPLTLQSGHVQQFGHVGIVRTMEGSSWSSVDGGQGGRNGGKDYIKWVKRGKYHPKQINGWCDIDIYFSTLAKLGKK